MILLLSNDGCVATPDIQLHPDAFMLIKEVKGCYARVSVWSGQDGGLIDYGWVKLDKGLEKKTIGVFDWSAME